MPAIHQDRDFQAAGGLMSYGSDVADSYRLALCSNAFWPE
jgi:hypothetical protein